MPLPVKAFEGSAKDARLCSQCGAFAIDHTGEDLVCPTELRSPAWRAAAAKYLEGCDKTREGLEAFVTAMDELAATGLDPFYLSVVAPDYLALVRALPEARAMLAKLNDFRKDPEK